MKYDVEHTCGCTISHTLFGKSADRDQKLNWLRSQPCLDCKKKAETEAAQVVAQENGLPPLTGTEKQVAWAETIRAKIWAQVERLENPPADAVDFIEWLFSHSNSKVWIETNDRYWLGTVPEWCGIFIVGLQRPTVNWRNYYGAWQDRLKTEAEAETKRQWIAWEKHVLDTLGAKQSIKVWTNPRDPDDRRIYRDDSLLYDKDGTGEGWAADEVALMKDLCKNWKALKLRRRT